MTLSLSPLFSIESGEREQRREWEEAGRTVGEMAGGETVSRVAFV